jgi:hypothetical protein
VTGHATFRCGHKTLYAICTRTFYAGVDEALDRAATGIGDPFFCAAVFMRTLAGLQAIWRLWFSSTSLWFLNM